MPGMLDGDASFEFLSGIEDGFGPQVHGGDVARLRPARQFIVMDAEPAIEPVRLHPDREPLTEEEIDQIMADWEIKEGGGECGL